MIPQMDILLVVIVIRDGVHEGRDIEMGDATGVPHLVHGPPHINAHPNRPNLPAGAGPPMPPSGSERMSGWAIG
jgi:hypothetical protein